MNRYEILIGKKDTPTGECPKGDNHLWVDDNGHSYPYCKKCRVDKKFNRKRPRKAVEPSPPRSVAAKCPKGGDHQWGIDGVHSNEFCKKCFVDKHTLSDRFITEDNKMINLFKDEL